VTLEYALTLLSIPYLRCSLHP